ncbi:hypothetical protein JTF08_05605 [Micrococcaceae bacterium RIT802]|nr:hypothetical protein [Micrococcaceae bacterium RIT 802]
MTRKAIQFLVPPVLFVIAQFIYAVVLDGPVGLTQLLVLAAIILAGSAVANSLVKRRDHQAAS